MHHAADAEIGPFCLNRIPPVTFGAGAARQTGAIAAGLATARALSVTTIGMIADPFLLGMPRTQALLQALAQTGAEIAMHSDFAGEPTQAQLETAASFLRSTGADLVVCIGGGSALDIGKIAAAIALSDQGPADFAMQGDPLPATRLPAICLPTTAGTGSEMSATNIFRNASGKKVWIWGDATKPEHVVLDPELTTTLPCHLTAWTGLDAIAHALESATNSTQNPGAALYAYRALALLAGALEHAVAAPDDLDARGRMLLGSAYAGISLDNCSAGMAHNISHALAALDHVHHGLATGLGLEVVLGWLAANDDGPFARAATACGLGPDGAALLGWFSELMHRCGVERRLPPGFARFGWQDLAAEMKAPENQSMRNNVRRQVEDADIDRFAGTMMAMV